MYRPAVRDRLGRRVQFGEVAQAGRRTGDLRVRLGQRLALFTGEQRSEVGSGRLHGVGRREQRGGAGGGVGPPVAPGIAGPFDDGVQLVRPLVGGLVDGLARRRIEDGEALAAGPRGATGLMRRHARGQLAVATVAAYSWACRSISARKAATSSG
ncbi:hypothetical protein SANTM175S_08488 [Streptomyces antimycoticus]